MKARHVMTTPVISVRPETDVQDVARRLIERNISAVPVVDAEGRILGIVSEGDLMRRPESETERHPSWWLQLLATPEDRAERYVKSHGLTAGDVMTRNVVTATEDTSVEDIAALLERHRIKRVPIVREGKIVGIVSRANLLHGLIAGRIGNPPSAGDQQIRKALADALEESGARTAFLNMVVSGGVVRIWGMIESADEKRAVHLAAQRVPGVKRVVDESSVIPTNLGMRYWE